MLISEYIYVEVYKIRQKILDVKIIYLTEIALGRFKKDCKTTKKKQNLLILKFSHSGQNRTRSVTMATTFFQIYE